MTIRDNGSPPRDPQTGNPLPPSPQPGYYPGFSTLEQQGFWDDATRKVVLERVESQPEFRFLDGDKAAVLEAVCERLIPQSDRTPERRIPIAALIDAREQDGVIDGFRFENMPSDGQALRLGLQAIEQMSLETYGVSFTGLGTRRQEEILKSIHDGDPMGAGEIWQTLPVDRFWLFIVQLVIEIYYAHPWAWDEIGFGGPAYPRGYMRLDGGRPEPWEVAERRYEWDPPLDSLSGDLKPLGIGGQGHPPSGQEGSH